MAIVEQMELVRHRSEIIADVRKMFDRYRSTFNSDVPKIDQDVVDKNVLLEIRKAVVGLEQELFG